MLENGKQLKRMLRLGWDIVLATPDITRSDFNTELEFTTKYLREDWNIGLSVLEEVGYLPVGETWSNVRQWIVSASQSVRGAILDAIQGYFRFSPTAQIALLTAQRQDFVVQRNLVRDDIQDVFVPFRDNPPAGVDSKIVDVIQVHIIVQRKVRDALNDRIAAIDVRLVELGV